MDDHGHHAVPWVACWAALGALVVIDAAIGSVALSGSYGLAVVLTGVLVTTRRTTILAVAAVAAAALSFVWNDNLGTLEWWLRLGVAVALAVLGVVVAVTRERRERRLLQVMLVAETAQRAVLRAMPAAVNDVGFAARYVSAAEEARIGGDLYEVISTRHGTRAIVGDVKGKGLEAVQLAASVLGAFRRAAADEPELTDVVRELDTVVASLAGLEDFVTALLVEFHPGGELVVVNAAHMPPVLISPGTAPVVLDTGEPVPPLGLHPEPPSTRATWEAGTRLLLYTDGTSEGRDRHGRFFEVTANAGLLAEGSLDEALDRLITALKRHVGHELTDDVALVLAERRSPATAP